MHDWSNTKKKCKSYCRDRNFVQNLLRRHNHNAEKSSKEDCFRIIEDQKFTPDEFINETFMSIVMTDTVQTQIEVHSILNLKILLVTSIWTIVSKRIYIAIRSKSIWIAWNRLKKHFHQHFKKHGISDWRMLNNKYKRKWMRWKTSSKLWNDSTLCEV